MARKKKTRIAYKQATYPFQAAPEELVKQIDRFVDVTVNSLSSFYLELPRGENFLEYNDFRQAYDVLRDATNGFQTLDRHVVRHAVEQNSLVLVVLRSIVGLSPPELADLATETQGVPVDQGFARSLDGKARRQKDILARARPQTAERILALIEAACAAIEHGPRASSPLVIHRLQKADTAAGLASVQHSANAGIEYPALLYERTLGRPFATHRDSVSEVVGHLVEDAIIRELKTAGVAYYRTGQAEKIAGFDQAPDFLVPDPGATKTVIEAKLTQDDGTARDKVTRVQHLDRLSQGGNKFEVIACIDGRGFRIRREDMRKLLLATRGKVFTMATMPYLVEYTGLKAFAKPK
jgi:hypothetical protein